MPERGAILVEIPEKLRIVWEDSLNLGLWVWELQPKLEIYHWRRWGYYNSFSIRFGLLRLITNEVEPNDLLGLFREIDRQLEKLSLQIEEVINEYK